MAAHPSILAWRIPWTEEPGGSQFMGLQLSLVATEQLTLSIFQGYELLNSSTLSNTKVTFNEDFTGNPSFIRVF